MAAVDGDIDAPPIYIKVLAAQVDIDRSYFFRVINIDDHAAASDDAAVDGVFSRTFHMKPMNNTRSPSQPAVVAKAGFQPSAFLAEPAQDGLT